MSDADTTQQAATPLGIPNAMPDSSATPLGSSSPAPTPQAQAPAPNQAAPSPNPAPNAAPVPGAKPSLWKTILQGALYGLAGADGAKHFGGGLAGGAKGYIEGKQQELQNHFASVQAAESIAKAARDAKTADLANTETQMKIDQQKRDANQIALERGEVDPYPVSGSTPAEMSSSGMAALNTVKANNSGVIPQMTIVQSPHGVGDNAGQHEADAYTVTLGDVRNNPGKVLVPLNRGRVLAGQPPFATIQDALAFGNTQTPGKGAVWVANAANDSYSQTHSLPTLSDNPAQNQTLSDTLGAKIDHIQKTGVDSSGKLTQDAADTIKLLQNQKDIVDTHNDTLKKDLAAQKGAEKTAEDKANEPFVEKEHAFQSKLTQETAAINRAGADANARNLKASEMITKEANDRDTDLTSISGVQKQIQMAQGGNQQAYQDAVTRFAEHEIKAGGMSRFNTVEQKELGPNVGSWGRQLETYASKGFTGKGAAPTMAEMQAVLNLETKQRNDLYNNHVGNIQQNILGQTAIPKADPASKFGGVTR